MVLDGGSKQFGGSYSTRWVVSKRRHGLSAPVVTRLPMYLEGDL